MSYTKAETQQLSLTAGTDDSVPTTNNDFQLEAENVQTQDTIPRKGVYDNGTVEKQFENAARDGIEIIMIDDDDDTEKHDSPVLLSNSQLRAQDCKDLEEIPQSQTPPSVTPRPKKPLFGKSLSHDTSAIPIDLLTPPASETGSPLYVSAFGVNEDTANWSFANSSISLNPISSNQSPVQDSESQTRVQEKVSPAISGGPLEVKEHLESEGLKRSKELRQKTKGSKMPENVCDIRLHPPSLPFPRPMFRQPESTLGVSNQEIDIVSSEDEAISTAWELEGEASGRFMQRTPNVKHNPYSRDAADKYRTQDRYLDNPKTTVHLVSNDIPQKTQEELQQAADRLNRIKQRQNCSNKKRKRSPVPKFLAIDLSDKPKRQRLDQSGINCQRTMSDALIASCDDGQISESHSDRMFSALETLQKKVDAPVPLLQEQDFDQLYPLPESDKIIGKLVASFSGQRGEVTRHRDICKDRLRDLNSIMKVNQKLAILLCVRSADQIIPKWLESIRVFSDAVLAKKRSGKLQRTKIDGIRGHIEKKLKHSRVLPQQAAIDRKLAEILRSDYFEQIQTEVPQLNREVEKAQAKSREFHNASMSAKKKSGRLLQGSRITGSSGEAAQSRKHDHAPSKLNKDIAAHKELLAQHDAHIYGTIKNHDNVESLNLDAGIDNNMDDDDISEEDDGEDYMRPSGFHSAATDDADQTVGTSDLQDLAAGSISPCFFEVADVFQQTQQIPYTGTQNPDEEMIQRMRQREAERLRLSLQDSPKRSEIDQTVESATEDEEQDTESESPDSDVESETGRCNTDEDANRTCWQYTVTVKTIGLGEDDKYDNLRYRGISKADAEKELNLVHKWFLKRFKSMHPNISVRNPRWSSKVDDEESIQELHFGYTEPYGFRASLMKETVNADQVEYEKGKLQKVLRKDPRWCVDFEKIIKPYQEPPETAEDSDTSDAASLTTRQPETGSEDTSNNAVDQDGLPVTQSSSRSASPVDDMDSLFDGDDGGIESTLDIGPPSTCSSIRTTSASLLFAAPKQIVERMNLDQLREFTEISGANRHAKNVFTTWYHHALPGRCNEDYHKMQDEAMEQELEDMCSRYLWEHQEECTITHEDGSKHTESMRVWVREVTAFGPKN